MKSFKEKTFIFRITKIYSVTILIWCFRFIELTFLTVTVFYCFSLLLISWLTSYLNAIHSYLPVNLLLFIHFILVIFPLSFECSLISFHYFLTLFTLIPLFHPISSISKVEYMCILFSFKFNTSSLFHSPFIPPYS